MNRGNTNLNEDMIVAAVIAIGHLHGRTSFYYYILLLEVRQKYSAARRIFNSLLGVSSGDETL